MAIHDPGPIVLAMLEDMRWTIREQTLQIPQFAVGGGFSSDVVVTNRSSTEPAAVAIDVWDPEGNALDGNLILGVGADRFDLSPSGSRTLTLSHDGGDLLTGSITVSSDTPVSAVVRFDFPGTGITGVGTSPRLQGAIAPVRRSGNLSSGVAIRNPELAAQTIDLELKDEDGLVVPGGEASRTIEAGGRIAEFIEQFFPEADTADFKGEISIRARAGQIAVIVLELEVGRAFTTLPVSPIVGHPRPTAPTPPAVSLSASPASIERGQSATLRWSSTNATSAAITPGIGTVPTSGSREVSPTSTTTYRITVRGAGGQTASASATVTVTEPVEAGQGCATGSIIESGSECPLEFPAPDAGVPFGRFAVGVQLGSEKGCLYIGAGFLRCGSTSVSVGPATITLPSGNEYLFDFAASKMENSSSWRISALSVTFKE